MKSQEMKRGGALLLLLCTGLLLLFVACKQEPAASDDTPKVKHKVTVDINGGTPLSETVYEVEDGATLDKLSETPSFDPTKDMSTHPDNLRRPLSGFKDTNGVDFTLGVTQVTNDITITAQWGFDPSLDCTKKTITQTNIVTYAKDGDLEGVACAIKNKIPLNQVGLFSLTPSFAAAAYNKFETLKYLIGSGADVYEKNTTNQNLLMRTARETSNLAMAKYLIAKGIDVNAKDDDGWTVFYYTATNYYEVVAGDRLALLKYLVTLPGVDINIRATAGNYNGLNALGAAKQLSSNSVTDGIISYLTNTLHMTE